MPKKNSTINDDEKQRIVFQDDAIVDFTAIKVVKKFGTTCHILLPRALLGKKVTISLVLEPQPEAKA
jgi:putative transposon-encoded protein